MYGEPFLVGKQERMVEKVLLSNETSPLAILSAFVQQFLGSMDLCKIMCVSAFLPRELGELRRRLLVELLHT